MGKDMKFSKKLGRPVPKRLMNFLEDLNESSLVESVGSEDSFQNKGNKKTPELKFYP